MEVIFTKEERRHIHEVARSRNSTHRNVSRADGKVIASSIKADIIGAAGECAVSKAFGIEWDGKLKTNDEWLKWRIDGHDVGPFEIRSTTHLTGRLILHKKDKDSSPYILVIVKKQSCEIRGWCWGRDGKRDELWEDVGYGRPCYYVPQYELKDINELIKIYRGMR